MLITLFCPVHLTTSSPVVSNGHHHQVSLIKQLTNAAQRVQCCREIDSKIGAVDKKQE